MHVFLISAQSLDGFIAQDPSEPSTNWTSKEDSQWFRERTKKAGVMVFGNSTFKTFGSKPLPNRLNIVYSREVLDPSGIDRQSENLWLTSLQPSQLLEVLEKEGYQEIAICGGASIYSMFMKAGLIDTLYLTIEPVLFGQGIKLFDSSVDMSQLQLKHVHQLSSQTVVLEYTIRKTKT